jgi:hypothetical protein
MIGQSSTGELMLEKYFSATKTLRRLRGGISGPYVDAFADDLNRDGYAPASAVRYIRAAAHLGCFVHRRGGVLADIDLNILDSFSGLSGIMPAAPQIWSERSARMSANGMRMPFETFFWNGPARVGRRPRKH